MAIVAWIYDRQRPIWNLITCTVKIDCKLFIGETIFYLADRVIYIASVNIKTLASFVLDCTAQVKECAYIVPITLVELVCSRVS